MFITFMDVWFEWVLFHDLYLPLELLIFLIFNYPFYIYRIYDFYNITKSIVNMFGKLLRSENREYAYFLPFVFVCDCGYAASSEQCIIDEEMKI